MLRRQLTKFVVKFWKLARALLDGTDKKKLKKGNKLLQETVYWRTRQTEILKQEVLDQKQIIDQLLREKQSLLDLVKRLTSSSQAATGLKVSKTGKAYLYSKN